MHEFVKNRSDLSFSQLQTLTSQFASYEQLPNPSTVLRRGIIEETFEYVQELSQAVPINNDKLMGELGDITWYVSEITRHAGIPIKEVQVSQPFTLDTLQETVTGGLDIMPIYDQQGQPLDPKTQQQEAIAITTLRLVDVMNPKDEELWIGHEARPSIVQAAKDLLACLAMVANENGIRLVDAVDTTLAKLASRLRQPHVIDEAAEEVLLSSARERLTRNPWIIALFVKQASGEK